ncbi:MAG TPA: exosortase H-associated membrane protein [Patescibacteria group bacterium]|nr:exosortase H-associated membrane protein [Patescibacteria group bacterium]
MSDRNSESLKAAEQAAVEEAARTVRLGTFFLVAVMWLAFSFAIWFALRTMIVFPVIRATHWVLTAWMPELFQSVSQSYQQVKLSLYAATHAIGGLPDSQFIVDISFDALKFCYGLPIYVGLTAATALWSDRYWPKILLGLVILPITQVFALIGNALKVAGFEMAAAASTGLVDAGVAPAVAQQVAIAANNDVGAILSKHWMNLELIAVWSQFGTLIVPVLAPVALWIALNGTFLRALQGSALAVPEPPPGQDGPTQSTPPSSP